MASRSEQRSKLRTAAQGTVLDRAIAQVAPVWAAKRMHARMAMATAAGYFGGSRSRRQTKDWTPGGTDPDSILADDREDLVDRSLDLERNSPIARGALNTNVTAVVGTGLRLNAQVDRDVLGWSEDQAQEFEAQAEREWKLFSESTECDHYRRHNFWQLTEIAFRSHLACGDVFGVLPMRQRGRWPYRTKIQLVEGTRCTNKDYASNEDSRLIDGVQLTEFGEAEAYHFCRSHPSSRISGARSYEWDVIPAYSRTGRRNVIHLARVIRPGQTRGEPYLAPVIESLKQLTRYSEAELMAAVVAGMFTVFVKSENGRGQLDPFNSETQDEDSADEYHMGGGAIVGLRDGEDISTANPGRPNTAYDPYVMAVLREIGVALELPYEVVVKHFTSSYTAAQGAIQEAWRYFMGRRHFLGVNWCQPIYEVFLEEAALRGRIAAPGFRTADPLIRAAYCGGTWHGPARGQLRQDIETKAARERIEIGLSTRKREAAEITGLDADDVHKRLVLEKRRRVEGGLDEAPAAVLTPIERDDDPDREDADETD